VRRCRRRRATLFVNLSNRNFECHMLFPFLLPSAARFLYRPLLTAALGEWPNCGIMKPSKIKSKVMKLDDGEPLPESNEEKDLKAIQRGRAGGLKGGKAKKPSAKKK
jgi:hypothetical protein